MYMVMVARHLCTKLNISVKLAHSIMSIGNVNYVSINDCIDCAHHMHLRLRPNAFQQHPNQFRETKFLGEWGSVCVCGTQLCDVCNVCVYA